jgi:hypothetical protein
MTIFPLCQLLSQGQTCSAEADEYLTGLFKAFFRALALTMIALLGHVLASK